VNVFTLQDCEDMVIFQRQSAVQVIDCRYAIDYSPYLASSSYNLKRVIAYQLLD
jgi:hypothetical protein